VQPEHQAAAIGINHGTALRLNTACLREAVLPGDVIGIVTPQTYCRWVMEQREGRRAKKAGRPKVARNACELIKRLARDNAGWGYRRIIG
jgi:hypothetical protein